MSKSLESVITGALSMIKAIWKPLNLISLKVHLPYLQSTKSLKSTLTVTFVVAEVVRKALCDKIFNILNM